ncbi:EAL domain-containing protein [Cytobacillus gottheilii]|uniref:EAL domain-containing protein n=1 Tax=Cytobacillus gottheilii TaxID=859144 RepID=UPI0015931B56|nr:EAL domain-containing protein [Cytobacillus gottheilii]
MVSLILYLVVCSVICVSLLNLNMHLTKTSAGKKMPEVLYTLFLAALSGFIISIIPYITLLNIKLLKLSGTSFFLTLKTSFYTVLFCFISFLLLNLIGKIAVKPSKADTNKKKGVLPYLVLSGGIALFILFYIVYLLESVYSISIQVSAEHMTYIVVILTSAIYNLARIFEHLHIDRFMINRSNTYTKSSVFFTVFSISFASTLYVFIEGLVHDLNFTMTIISLISLLVLFIITINYIENQLIYQHRLVENQNMKLNINEQQYRSLFQYNPDAIFILDLEGNFKEVNPSVPHLTGYTLEEILQLKIADLLYRDETEKLKSFIYETLKGSSVCFETFILTKHKEVVNLKVTATQIKVNDSITGIYAIAQDITEQNKIQKKINYLAYHDELTGLLNRRAIENEVKNQISRNAFFATILIDVDLFKDINDHLGHAAGDTLLKLITMRLKQTVKKRGLIARLGGDEFLVCLTEVNSDKEVKEIAEDIQLAMKMPFEIEGQYKEITLSIGISYYPKDGQVYDTLIKHADMAMYAAKRAGRNHYSEYKESLEIDMISKITMSEELKIAIEEEQFELYYQPKHSAKGAKVIGAEALIRWQHPTKGFVSPGDFIPLAEETNLIIQLGNWIIREALRQYNQWANEAPIDFQLSINISPKQFIDPNFIPLLMKSLEEFNVPAEKIDIEITESLAIENTELTKMKISILKELGLEVTMDDFGTGYTSLTFLSKFPLNRIKIDQSFIRDLPGNKSHTAIVQSLVSAAKNLGIKATAEGVETAEQLQCLREWECDEIQGFYYSKPLPTQAFLAYWSDNENSRLN